MKTKIIYTALIIFLISTMITLTKAQNKEREKPNVAILIFEGVQIIDYTGPYEVLGSRQRRNVFTVAEKPDVVTTNMGMKVVPNYTLENHPKADVLVIPGGGNSIPGDRGRGVGAQLDNQKVIKWIKENSKQADYVLSVCNGAFLLARAGLLDNMEATTTAGMISDLKAFSPTTKVVYDKRYVDNGKIITTAGLSSGIDGALRLVEKMDGLGWAKMVAISIEYNWQPESDYARAALADTKLPGSIYRAFFSDAEPLDMNGGRDDWEEKWIVTTPASAEELLENVNKQWANEADWKQVKTGKSESFWKANEKDGKVWNGYVIVEPLAAKKDKLLLTLRITNAKKEISQKIKELKP